MSIDHDSGTERQAGAGNGDAGQARRKEYVQPTLLRISHVDSEGAKGTTSPTEVTFAAVSPS